MEKVNLAQKFSLFQEAWSPKIVGDLNGQYVKLARLKGEFIWHHHEHEDEMFLVIQGRLTVRFRGGDVHLQEGEFLIIPHGMEHLPVAEEEALVMLFEPKTTLNTGNIESERTHKNLDVI